jgi:hypothetical protein
MFLLNGSPLQVDVAFSYNGVSYPSNWLRLTTLAEKEAIGITEVADPVRYDDRFYWDAGLPKDLDDLKTEWNRRVDDMAYTMLLPSDWMVVRKQETGTDIPADWATYRAAVRSAAAANKTALNAATDIDGFVSVATTMSWPRNPNATI